MKHAPAPRRAVIWTARLLAVGALGLALVAVALPTLGGYGYLSRLLGSPEAIVAASFPLVGALLVDRPSGRSLGWLLIGIGWSAAVYVVAVSYTAYVLGGDQEARLPAGADLAELAAWASGWAWFPAWLLVATVLPAVVPNGEPLSRGWRMPLYGAAIVLVLATISFAVSPGAVSVFPNVPNPLAVPTLAAALDPVLAVLDPVSVVLVGSALASLVARFVWAEGTERRQLGWVGYGVGLAVVLLVGMPLLFPSLPSAWSNLAVLLVPAGIAVAGYRYRLHDVDRVVNRTLVVLLLLGGTALVYAALVGWLSAMLPAADGVATFLAAFGVALVFHPARSWLQTTVDRLFHGRRGEPYSLLEEVHEVLRSATEPRSALDQATALVRRGLRLPGVEVVVPLTDGEVSRTLSGQLHDPVETIALEVNGEAVGELRTSPRTGQHRLAKEDLRVLASAGVALASAAYALRASARLADSHRHLLGAREEERRRLRRDLHDGLGPQLAGIVMGLDAASSALARDDADRAAQLTELVTAQSRDAVADVRRLVSGLRPPVLDDLGLVGALKASAPLPGHDRPTVEVRATGELERLPAVVELAAYRIAQEALTNAFRHADAAHVVVVLDARTEGLEVAVRDDGCGLPAVLCTGVGLVSMRERAVELGGSCSVWSDGPGRGTAVQAWLPLVPA